ncbi:MAG: acetate/propionate family kinase [Sulfitobacter sp.]
MSGVILTINSGSSSVKFAVYAVDNPDAPALITGKITGIGGTPAFAARDPAGTALEPGTFAKLDPAIDQTRVVALLLPWVQAHLGDDAVQSVGHRVVHGGQHFDGPMRVTDDILQQLEALSPLAPLHQPSNLAAIRAVAQWQPDLPQIACFDTSFHRSQPRLSQLFALPRALSNEGIRRYGFHGLSYEYIASTLPLHLDTSTQRRVVVAHLGNGSSICAMKDLKSVSTSMGFTALDGLMMGRRCGTLDPGVVLYLMQAKGMTAPDIEDLLYRQSGLLGVSGISNNMQELLNSDHPNAREAVDLYCARAARVLSGLLPAIGGLDALVFTAGIGENAAEVRAQICTHLGWLGVEIDAQSNAAHAAVISPQSSDVQVLVIPTDEEAIVARACRSLAG